MNNAYNIIYCEYVYVNESSVTFGPYPCRSYKVLETVGIIKIS